MANRKLRYFRIVDGKRIPHMMELDAEMTVITEYADMSAVDHVAKGRTDTADEMSPDRKKAHTMARWATKAVDENPIPGTEDLRVAYMEELEQLKASYADQPCPPCKQGELIRKYRTKLERGNWL